MPRALPPPIQPDRDAEREELQRKRNELVADREFYALEGWSIFEASITRFLETSRDQLEDAGLDPIRSEFLRGRIGLIKTLLEFKQVNEAAFNRNSARFEELRLQEEEDENG